MVRVRRGTEFWKERIQQWMAGGLSAREFAAREGLTVERLWVWKRRLSAQAALMPSAKASGAKPSFLPVVIAASRSSASPSPLEVVMRSGHTVRVPVDFDDAALLRLLTVLGGN